MTEDMGDDFKETIMELKDDTDVKVVILTGDGRAFSAGGDLNALVKRSKNSPLHNSKFMKLFYSRFLSLRDLPVPVIAAINGHAIGAGLCVACACDIRVCAENAKLGFTFINLGLHPGMAATKLLPAIIGPELTARVLLTGEVFNGHVAKEIGLVSEVLPQDKVLARAMEIAESIAEKAPTTVQALTRTLRLNTEINIERALWREADAQAQCYADPQFSKDIQSRIDAIS